MAMRITVQEACELAKAGIKLEWEDVKYDVVSVMNQPLNPPPATNPFAFSRDDDNNLYQMLSFRMHWDHHKIDFGRVHPTGFRCVTVHKADAERVLVFVVTTDGKHTVLEDEWKLFPSDTLITQLRLLEQ